MINSLIVIPDYHNHHYIFPMGIAYIHAALKEKNFSVSGINLSELAIIKDSQFAADKLQSILAENKIDIVMCGALTTELKYIRSVFETAKKFNPDIITIGGGGGFTSEPVIFSQLTGVDYAVLGEGEVTICQLVDAIENNKDVSSINGIVYRQGDEYILTGNPGSIKDINSIPLPDYSGFEFERYLERNPSMPMILARSCPYRCRFCFHPSGNKYRQRDFKLFFEELKVWIKQYNISSISLVDELFCSTKQKIKDFCEMLTPYGVNWTCQMRVETADVDVLQLMKGSGCTEISYGFESHCQRILDHMGKGIKCAQIDRAAQVTYDVGLAIQGNFIFGDELEDWASVMETLQWWYDHRHYGINLGFIMVYPGTGYYKSSVERGLIKDKKGYIEAGCQLINMSRMTNFEVIRLQALEWFVSDNYLGATNVATVMESTYIDDLMSYRLSIKCAHCGEVFYADVYKDIAERKLFRVCCSQCGRRNQLSLIESDNNCKFDLSSIEKYMDIAFKMRCGYVTKCIEYLRSKFKRIGVYGAGGNGNLFLTLLESANTDIQVAYVADRDAQKLDVFKNRYHVTSVDSLDDYNVDAIIVTPLSFTHEIVTFINNSCPKSQTVCLQDFAE